MKVINNKLIPEWVVDENLNFIPFDKLDNNTRRKVFEHSQHVSVLNNRPFMKMKLDNTETVMKLEGGFTGAEFMEIVTQQKAKGKVVQWDVQRIHGGSQGATSPGKIEIGDEQIAEKILRNLGIKRAYNQLPLSKRMDRLHKFFGVIEEFKVKPRVKIGEEVGPELEGLIFASQEWMDACGIPWGAKTTFITKGLIVPAPLKDCDILIPANENKWKLSEKKLSEMMRWRPDQSPEFVFSRNLKRWPTARFDLQALLDHIPGRDFEVDLVRQKEIYQGADATAEEIYTMFGYENGEGEKVLRDEGIKMLLGESIHEQGDEGAKALTSWCMNALQPGMAGFYGIIMPMSLLPEGSRKITVWYTRWPWTMPIQTRVGIYEHCIFVDEELQQLFGGDFDRDQGACYYKDTMDNGYAWPKDKEKLKELFALPEKADGDFPENWDEYQVIAYQLDQYNGCGVAYNNARIAIDVARSKGLPIDKLRDMDIILSSKIVQPFIDGFKYHGAGQEDAPSVHDMLTLLDIRHTKQDIDTCTDLFRTLRGRGATVDDMVMMAELVEENGNSFYEKALINFKGWIKPKGVQRGVDPDVDDIVKQSYIEHMNKNNVQELRFKEIRSVEDSYEFIHKVLMSCWDRNDIGLARYIMNSLRKELKYEELIAGGALAPLSTSPQEVTAGE